MTRPTLDQIEDLRIARAVAERMTDGESVTPDEARFVARLLLAATAEPTEEKLAEEAAVAIGHSMPMAAIQERLGQDGASLVLHWAARMYIAGGRRRWCPPCC